MQEIDNFVSRSDSRKLRSQMNCISPSTISFVDTVMLSKIFDRKDWTERIFGKRIVVSWVPCRPIKSNIAYIFQETTSVIGSNLHDVDRLLITFELQYDAAAGIVVSIDVYGNVTENLQTHIEQHIKHAVKPENHRNIIVQIFHDLDLNIDVIGKVMNSFGFVKRRLHKVVTNAWVLESKL